MSGEETYSYPLLAIGLLAITVGIYTYWKSTSRLKKPYLALMLGLAFLSVTYFFELNATDLSTKLFWNDLEYIPLAAIPSIFIVLMLEYTGYEKWLNWKVILLTSCVPIISLILLWTNDAYHLFYTSSTLVPLGQGLDIHMTYGIGFYVFTAGLYLTLLAGIILLFHTYLNTSRLYRGQTGVILIAIIVPTLANLIGVVGLNPIPFTYLVVIGLTVAVALVFWGIFWFRAF